MLRGGMRVTEAGGASAVPIGKGVPQERSYSPFFSVRIVNDYSPVIMLPSAIAAE
jgi:hypothetical protein